MSVPSDIDDDRFAEFPETHWVGETCIYVHQRVDRHMPEALCRLDGTLCRIEDLGLWTLSAGRFCARISFLHDPDENDHWTTIGHLRPLGKPRPKPPSIDTVLARTNCQEDLEKLSAFLDGLEKRHAAFVGRRNNGKNRKIEESIL